MNILFYTSFNSRSRDTETLMLKFKDLGHTVHFITQSEGKVINDFLRSKGIHVTSHQVHQKGIRWLIAQALFLIRYNRKNNIDLVFAHLESACYVAAVAQFFMRARTVLCRHHIDEVHLLGAHKALSYRLTYSWGKEFIVVSKKAKEFMTETEKIPAKKINVINLSYDFNLYQQVNPQESAEIKKRFPAHILMVVACRLVRDKRPELSIDVLENLVAQNLDVKLLILGDGPLTEDLKVLVAQKKLEQHCFFTGRVSNILDYLHASDLLLHPSILDSSSVIVKEVGLVSRIAIVCRGIGDFDDYMTDRKNAILVDKSHFVAQAEAFIMEYAKDKEKFKYIGENLQKDIYRLFSVENNIGAYNKYLS